jgi:hypothetical protein
MVKGEKAEKAEKPDKAATKAAAGKATIKEKLAESKDGPTRADTSGMLGHMKYHAGKDADVAEALSIYNGLAKDQKANFYALYKADKSCKWIRSFSLTITSSSSSSGGMLAGVCNWHES